MKTAGSITGLLVCASFSLNAHASPNIQSVIVTNDAKGNPSSLSINGTGFTCTSCTGVRVRLGGVLLPSGSITVNSANSITVAISGYAPGDYKLRVTALPLDDDSNAALYDLTLGAVGAQGPAGAVGPPGPPGPQGA